MKRYGRLDENLQGTLQKNRVFCAVMPIHDQRISRRTETRRLFELTKLKKAPSFVIVGLFSADHYLVPCLSLLSSECVVFTDVPRDFQRLAEYFSDGWRREGLIDSSCLFKIGAEVCAVRWKISNNTHPVPVLNNTHPFPSKCSVDALCRVRESVRFASERSRVRIPPGPPSLCDKIDVTLIFPGFMRVCGLVDPSAAGVCRRRCPTPKTWMPTPKTRFSPVVTGERSRFSFSGPKSHPFSM